MIRSYEAPIFSSYRTYDSFGIGAFAVFATLALNVEEDGFGMFSIGIL